MQKNYVDLMVAAIAFGIQTAIDLDGEVSDERVKELRELETRLIANIESLGPQPFVILTHDFLGAFGNLLDMAKRVAVSREKNV